MSGHKPVRPEPVEGRLYNTQTSFKVGSRVRHSTLGTGIVKGTEGSGDMEKVTVQFPAGIKKLLAKVAGLEIA